MEPKRSASRITPLLAERRFPLAASAAAVALTLPSLFSGLHLDDHIHRLLLTPQPQGSPVEPRAAWDVFNFFPADPSRIRKAVQTGALPWWSPPDLRLSFFRPVTSLTHWVDYNVWPDAPWLMHAQNLLWLAALTWIVARLFQAVSGVGWEAGVAGLMFAVDPGHGLPAAWVANRNALISSCFAALALLLYVKSRRGLRACAWIAPAALLAAYASGEMALGAPGYLLAYALLLDDGPAWRRLVRLAPCALVTLAWIGLYKSLGYGATASHMYLDPGSEPVRFLGAVAAHLPALVLAQLLAPPADLYNLLHIALRPIYVVAAGLGLTALLGVMFRRVGRDRVAAFWLLGMGLAALPCCGTAASNRLLVLAGIGGAGLIGRFLASFRAPDTQPSVARASSASRWTRRALIAFHLVLAPPALILSAQSVLSFEPMIRRIAASLPTDQAVAGQDLIVLQAPTNFLLQYAVTMNLMEQKPVPRRMYVLGATTASIEIRRIDERTLSLRPRNGFLEPPGTGADMGEGVRAALSRPCSTAYLLQMFEVLFRSLGEPFSPGEEIDMGSVRGRVEAVTADGRPWEVRFTFEEPLEAARWRWMTWSDGVLTEATAPASGAAETHPPARVRF